MRGDDRVSQIDEGARMLARRRDKQARPDDCGSRRSTFWQNMARAARECDPSRRFLVFVTQHNSSFLYIISQLHRREENKSQARFPPFPQQIREASLR
jgi:hypothetical protein